MNRDKLAKLAINITDGEHGTIKNSPDSEYLLLSNKNIINGSIIVDTDDRRISKNSFDKIRKRTKLSKHDVVIATVGTIGKSATIKDDIIKYDFQRSVGIVKCNTNKLLPSYLHYFLQIRYVQKQLLNRSNASVQKCLYIGDLEDLEIDYFEDINYQKKIINILSCLDSKIELNNEINAKLESVAKTIFDYWFLQFDFPDKNGKPYKSSGGKMVWNEKLNRDIPEGWGVKKIGEVASIKAGGDKTIIFSPKKTEACSIPIYSNGISNDGLYGYTDKSTINKKSVTISARGTIGHCVLRNKPFVPIIRLIVITPHFSDSSSFIYQSIKCIGFGKSGSVQQQLTSPSVSNIHILYPPTNILKEFETMTISNINQAELFKEQNQQLTFLRDWLLPLLMNGQVVVK